MKWGLKNTLQDYLHIYLRLASVNELIRSRIRVNGNGPHTSRCDPQTRFKSILNDRLEDNDRCRPVSFDWMKLTETLH